ncbi:MAG: ferrochelatase [Deltaproteobacteria bacterium]|nr:ferrochelatase [Deltaproteobacteria bacterium]
MPPKQTGVLLMNTGTPDAPTVRAVGSYLREFLSDPRVVDIPVWARFILVNGVIVPFRSRASAKAYAKVWTEHGSPLMNHSLKFAHSLHEELGDTYCVSVGMQYGSPSIKQAMQTLEHCSPLIVFPLFPHYAASSWGSAVAKVLRELSGRWNIPPIHLVPPFYNADAYLEVMADRVREFLDKEFDHVLFSFHGLPLRHLTKSGCQLRHPELTKEQSSKCLSEPDYCYRAQCYESVRLLTEKVGIQRNVSISFQSRLGRTPWIQPFTDKVIEELAARHIRKLGIVCPSFVADCLETLEEIGIRATESWKQWGGESLSLLPSLNDDPLWVRAAGRMVRDLSLARS